MNCEISRSRLHDRMSPTGQSLDFHPPRDLELGLSFSMARRFDATTFFSYQLD